jgi:hypothetical protein
VESERLSTSACRKALEGEEVDVVDVEQGWNRDAAVAVEDTYTVDELHWYNCGVCAESHGRSSVGGISTLELAKALRSQGLRPRLPLVVAD